MFKDAFLTHARLVRRWELFGCDTIDRKIEGPSWVADRIQYRTRTWMTMGLLATGASELYMEYVAPDKLNVAGLPFAVVGKTSEQISVDPPKAISTIREWAKDNLFTGSASLQMGPVLATTLIQGCYLERWRGTKSYPSLDSWVPWVKNNVFGSRKASSFSKSSFLNEHLPTRCEGTVLFLTKAKDSHLGLDPNSMQEGDVICPILGCDQPLVLRPLQDGTYRFMGNCYVESLLDANGLLGPLESPRRREVLHHETNESRKVYRFFNTETKEATDEDPRLGPLEGWTRMPVKDLGWELTGDDPEIFDFFRSADGQTIVDSDPRLSAKASKAKGVPIKTLAII